MNYLVRFSAAVLFCLFLVIFVSGCQNEGQSYDVVIYGGTSSGVTAAVQAVRMGKTVIVIEQGGHLGGLSAGGLGATDIGNKHVIGGLAREFYHRLWVHYKDESAWKYETSSEYNGHLYEAGEETMWTFEPHVAEKVFNDLIAENNVPVVFGERLDLVDGVVKDGGRIVSIKMESGRTFTGKMFIDATYEGDLMAGAGISYTVGREANAKYGETINGMQTIKTIKHQFKTKVDPYVVAGDASSGLLPGVNSDGPGEEFSGDHRVQGYCFRMCMTDEAENRIAWPKPAGYDPLRYELLLRNFEAGDSDEPWHSRMMPNRKTDTNNNHAFSTDNIGMNYDYPDADHKRRAEIIAEHETYQKGLMWTLANDPRVPEKVRQEARKWGLSKDEFVDNGNWPHQLYIREARRMISDYVMTENNCRGTVLAGDSVGMGAYGMDSHNVQRYVDADGFARNEGDIQVHGFKPYPISYRSIVPKTGQCPNLVVPVCISASHIGFGSIRMEPVFMVLGQSAATVACLAIDDGVDAGQVDYEKLRIRLIEDEQVLDN